MTGTACCASSNCQPLIPCTLVRAQAYLVVAGTSLDNGLALARDALGWNGWGLAKTQRLQRGPKLQMILSYMQERNTHRVTQENHRGRHRDLYACAARVFCRFAHIIQW